jgi:DNA-binding Lrp family transcriptional regulator
VQDHRLTQEGVRLERLAREFLPEVLSDLLDEPVVLLPAEGTGRGPDIAAAIRGRSWVFEVKGSSRPGTVARAAEQLQQLAAPNDVAILVVPFMSRAGAAAAAERHLNWVDLSGNAHIRTDHLYVSFRGEPNRFPQPGRPSSAFAPKSARVARLLLLDPERWWRQKEIAERTGLDDGHVSRIVRRLDAESLIERDGTLIRPNDPVLMLDAWAADYRFDRHDVVIGHQTGSGLELARQLHDGLSGTGIGHAFTGLPAAWALQPFARFRLASVCVTGDPREAADAIGVRRNERGANVQLIGPDDQGVFLGQRDRDGLPCVSPAQVYLDLLHLPERARDAAQELRDSRRLWESDA